MGIPPDQDYIPGVDCAKCWGEGKEFGDFHTPKHVLATFSGLFWPCEGYNGEYLLIQTEGNPCIWEKVWNGSYIRWHASGASSRLVIYDFDIGDFCFDCVRDICETHFAYFFPPDHDLVGDIT